jgi:hypothetical protein
VDGLREKREIKSNMEIKIYIKKYCKKIIVSRNIVRGLIVHYELTEIIMSRNVVHALIVHYELIVVIFFISGLEFFFVDAFF